MAGILLLVLAFLPPGPGPAAQGSRAGAHEGASGLERGGWTEENHGAILAFLERSGGLPGRKAAVFDFDNTCIYNDIGDAVFARMVDRGLFDFGAIVAEPSLWEGFASKEGSPARAAVEAFAAEKALAPRKAASALASYPAYREAMREAYEGLCRLKGNEACYGWVVRLQAGKTPEQMREIALRTLRAEMRKPLREGSGIRPYREMRGLMDALRSAGFEVWIVSASGRRVVEAAARELFGVPESRVLGVETEEEDGRLSSRLLKMTYGAGKVEAIREFIGVRPLLAAGDSDGDLEMLEYSADLRIVIDRKKKVSELARRRKAEGAAWLLQPRFLP